jgi:hypothetical protein
MVRSVALLIFVAVFLNVGSWCQAQVKVGETNDLRDRLFSEAPGKWKEYLSIASRLQGSVRGVWDVGHSQTKLHGEWERLIRQNEHCASVLLQNVTDKEESTPPQEGSGLRGIGDQMIVVGSGYSFFLFRPEKEKPWAINGILKGNKIDVEGIPIRDDILSHVAMPLRLDDLDLPSLLNSKGFSISRVKEITRDGRKLVEAGFHYPHELDKPGKFFISVQGGTMVLDPENYWCLTEYAADCLWGNAEGKLTANFEYRRTANGIPIISRVSKVHKIQYQREGAGGGKTEVTFDLSLPTELPRDEEFLISRFGFPEPNFLTENNLTEQTRHVPLHLWFILLGTLCIVATLALCWLRAKRQRNAIEFLQRWGEGRAGSELGPPA